MILSVRVNNYRVYSNDAELSLIADMRIKRFRSNVYKQNKFNVLKSACIYGANNSGKTCFLLAINSIKNVLLGIVADVTTNLFNESKVCSLGVTFFSEEKVYSYDFKYDATLVNNIKNGFVYECLKELSIDKSGNQKEKEIFVRDTLNDVYRFADNDELSNVLGLVSTNNILIYTINSVKYPIIEQYRKLLREFALNIEVINMYNIPIMKTIEVLKSNDVIKDRTVELIKLADLDIEDYKYVKNDPTSDITESNPKPQELVLAVSELMDDMLRLTSVHKGKALPSLRIDSTGTKKIVAVSSYIIEALDKGKMLIIDEFDSSLHFKLTRALVSLFNNDLNKNAQLIFTAHDVTLLDCKRLFRKDQIWFAGKDEEDGAYLYPLSDFTASDDHVRSETDMFEKYSQGKFGALPEPDLIEVLLNSDEG